MCISSSFTLPTWYTPAVSNCSFHVSWRLWKSIWEGAEYMAGEDFITPFPAAKFLESPFWTSSLLPPSLLQFPSKLCFLWIDIPFSSFSRWLCSIKMPLLWRGRNHCACQERTYFYEAMPFFIKFCFVLFPEWVIVSNYEAWLMRRDVGIQWIGITEGHFIWRHLEMTKENVLQLLLYYPYCRTYVKKRLGLAVETQVA